MTDRGFVLVNALVVVAALAGVAVLVLDEAGRGLDRLGAAELSQRQDTALGAAALLARRLLRDDLAATDTDHPGEAWALADYRTDVDGVPLRLSVADLQGRLNLNLLLAEDATAAEASVRALCLSAGWSDADVAGLLAAYTRRRPPAEAAARQAPEAGFAAEDVALPQELAADGVSAEALESLGGLVSFLPRTALVNVNTAAPGVIAALAGSADQAAATQFEALRATSPFPDIEAFRAAVASTFGPDAAARLPDALLSVASEWFLAEATASLDPHRAAAAYLLHRTETGVAVVARIPGDG
jgi:general secretion pathway protein K